MDCFYVQNLPDMNNRLLQSRIFHILGFCELDIFRPNFGRQYNFGSCKIFMPHELSMKFDLFKLVPHECITFDFGFEYPVIISRWVKNVVEAKDNDNLWSFNYEKPCVDLCCENDFKCYENEDVVHATMQTASEVLNNDNLKLDVLLQCSYDINPTDDIPRLAWVFSGEIWREAIIIEESGDEYYIHYRGVQVIYDQWIKKDSTRIKYEKPEG